MDRIGVFLADDNLLVREGVRALLEVEPDLEVVGVASDYEGLVVGAEDTSPQVIVTDIRMPPSFGREGIEAAAEVRKRHPGTGVVVLSQYDDPDYAISLLSEGAAGCAYLLKDRVSEGDQLARAVREVAGGGSMLDPHIVETMVRPVSAGSDLSASDERLLQMVAEGRPVKAIAAATGSTPGAAAADVERLFLRLAEEIGAGDRRALHRLTRLHQATIALEEQGETLSRLLPAGITDYLRTEGTEVGRPVPIDVTILMSDIRGYSTIAERAEPSSLAIQLHAHRAAMDRAITESGGTVMQFVGDAVMAVFGAPAHRPDHPSAAVSAASAMHLAQEEVNRAWMGSGLPPFGLGIGISTGAAAAALLGSEHRFEYSVVGDVVNLAQRIQQWAGPGETVLSRQTYERLHRPIDAERLEPALVKGRTTPVEAYRIASRPPAGIHNPDESE